MLFISEYCAPAFQNGIAGDAHQEGANTAALLVEPLRHSPQHHETVLRDIIGRFGGASHPKREAVNCVFVFREDGLEGGVGHGVTNNYRDGWKKIWATRRDLS